MKRDLELKGKSYVDQEYPPRVMFCIPILVEPAKARCRAVDAFHPRSIHPAYAWTGISKIIP